MNDQELYEALCIAHVHALTAHRAAAMVRPDIADLVQSACIVLSACRSTAALAVPCEVCGGRGCAECHEDR